MRFKTWKLGSVVIQEISRNGVEEVSAYFGDTKLDKIPYSLTPIDEYDEQDAAHLSASQDI